MQINLTLFFLYLGLLCVIGIVQFWIACTKLEIEMLGKIKQCRNGKRYGAINLNWYCLQFPVYNLPKPAIIEQVRQSTMLEF